MREALRARLGLLAAVLLAAGLLWPPTAAAAQDGTATATPTATATGAPTATATGAPTATAVATATAVPTAAATLTPVPTQTAGPTLTPGPAPQANALFIPLILKRAGQIETGVQVQNLSGAAADVTITYYDQDGRTLPQWAERATAGPNDSTTFYTPGNPNLPDGFVGSAVIQASQPVGAIVNQQTQPNVTPFFVGTFDAQHAPATSVFLPYAVKQVGGRSSTLTVQNASTAPANVEARFFTVDGLAGRVTLFLPPFAARRLILSDHAELPGNMDASAVLLSDQPIVAIGDVYDSATGIFQLYTGLAGGAGSQLAPLLFKDRNGWDSEIRVQNVSASAVSVRVRVQPTGGGTEITTPAVTVGPNAPYTFRPRDVPELESPLVASAQVEASGNVAAVVSEYNTGRGTGMAYNAFGPSDATTRMSIPLIFKDRNGYDTGVQIQNVDNTDAQVRITYRLSTGATTVDFAVVPAGGSYTFYQPEDPNLPAGSVGSAVVENIAGGQRLVAIVNEVNYARGGDASSTYEGLNY
jgi:hypothetical protein